MKNKLNVNLMLTVVGILPGWPSASSTPISSHVTHQPVHFTPACHFWPMSSLGPFSAKPDYYFQATLDSDLEYINAIQTYFGKKLILNAIENGILL